METAATIAETTERLAAALAIYREAASAKRAPYLFEALAGSQARYMGLLVLDKPEAVEDSAQLGYLVPLDEHRYPLTEPEPLHTVDDVCRELGSLSIGAKPAHELWYKLVRRVEQRVGDGVYPSSGVLQCVEGPEMKWPIAWERRQLLIDDRIAKREVHEGHFGFVQKPRNNKPTVRAWERRWKNPFTDHEEVHVMDRDFAWLLEENTNISYLLSEPLWMHDGRDYIAVVPNEADALHALDVHTEFEQHVEKVERGQTMYGSFGCVFSEDRSISRCFIKVREGNQLHKYVVRRADRNLFRNSARDRRGNGSIPKQSAFFEVIKSQVEDHDPNTTVHFCRVVGPPPNDMPKALSERTYRRLRTMTDTIERIDGDQGWIFRSKRA